MSEPTRFKVVTGLSGSGISTAINALEDLGYFCVDNLPAPLLPKLLELAKTSDRFKHLAVGLDARNVGDPQSMVELLKELDADGNEVDVLYLEASDAVLLRRFSVSRRRHPLDKEGSSLPDAIRRERETMHPMRELARHVVDTSDLNVHECKAAVMAFASGERQARMAVTVLSFGFRHGLPTEADLVWDVRFLPNPHFIPELRPHSGLDTPVADFVLKHTATQGFLGHFLPLLDGVLPAYEHEGKSYLTVAVGCTGGRHRSVAIAEHVAAHLKRVGLDPKVRHRDIHKGAQ